MVRHIARVLELVGLGAEDPAIVSDLLDTGRYPAKPCYGMASDLPLNLYRCQYAPQLGLDGPGDTPVQTVRSIPHASHTAAHENSRTDMYIRPRRWPPSCTSSGSSTLRVQPTWPWPWSRLASRPPRRAKSIAA